MTDSLAIEAIGLRKSFRDVQAVRGLDLRVVRGEVFGLLGPNGAGKTTTLEMLEGLVLPDSGQIRVLGMDWRDHGTAIRTRIGVQFQSTELDDQVKVREALEMFGSFYPRARAPSELLRLLHLEERAIFNDGAGLASQWTGIAIVAAWTAVLFVVATRRFKWV